MIYVRTRHRCNDVGGCSKRPHYGLPGNRATCCRKHQGPGMINVHFKLCEHPGGCSKTPSYGPPGSRAARCAAHREAGMVCVKNYPRPRNPPSSGPASPPDLEQQGPTMPAAAVGSTRGGSTRGGSTGSGGMGGGPRIGAGGGPSVAAAASVGGGRAPPLESSSRPALLRRHPISQSCFVPLAMPLESHPASPLVTPCSTVAPSPAAAAHESKRRPRHEAPVTDEEGEAVDSSNCSSKRPRGADPPPPPQVAWSPPAAAAVAAPHGPSSGAIAPALQTLRSQVERPPAGPPPAAHTPLLGGRGGTGRGTGAAKTIKQEMRQAEAPSPSPSTQAGAPSGASAVTPPSAITPTPPLAPVSLSSVLVLEALLRSAVALVVPLLPPPAPRRLVDSWLELWEGCMHELEEHLDMDVLCEGGLFQRRLAAAVEGGEAKNCERMLRMLQLLQP